MAFKMKYDKTSFPFLGRNKESWQGDVSGKQVRTTRRMNKHGGKRYGHSSGRNIFGRLASKLGLIDEDSKFGRTKYQRNIDRKEQMGDKWIHQGKVGDGQGNIIEGGTQSSTDAPNYGKYYYEPSIMGSEGTTAEQNQQLANLRHKG